MKCTFNRINNNEGSLDVIKAPPSKSIAHRALICAALADGVSNIYGLELSEDIKATINCLKALGTDIDLKVQYESDIKGNETKLYTATVRGLFTPMDETGEKLFVMDGKHEEFRVPVLDCNECGSTLRFMIPVCTLMYSCNLIPGNQSIKLTGSNRLLSRPLDVYDKLFEYTYVTFSHNSDMVEVEGKLNAGDYTIDGNISSQFVTGLLFALPKLSSDSRLHILPPVESRPYIDITIDILDKFGISVKWEDENTLYIPGNQNYVPKDIEVEGDWSNGAILYTLSRLSSSLGHAILLTGLSENSVQGDKIITDMLEALDNKDIVDISDYPDLGPILLAYLAAIGGGKLTGTKRLKIKESDRGNAMKEELAKMGAILTIGEDDIDVTVDDGLYAPTDVIDSHNDHRIAMSMSVLCSLYGGTVEGIESIDKSFPSFIDTLKRAGIDIC